MYMAAVGFSAAQREKQLLALESHKQVTHIPSPTLHQNQRSF